MSKDERKPLNNPQKVGSTHGTFTRGDSIRPTDNASMIGNGSDLGPAKPEKVYRITEELKIVFTNQWQLKILLVCVPIALAGRMMHLTDGILFFASFFGLIPLAALLGDFTEDVALRSNDIIGALLNVTFGNATEMIISAMALRHGMLDVIKFSLIGSVLGNMLLVLGSAFLYGGMKHKNLTFNAEATNTYSPLLLLSVLGWVIPSGYGTLMNVAKTKHQEEQMQLDMLKVSRQVAVVACIVYAAYIFFQLYTHKSMFDALEEAGGDDDEDNDKDSKSIKKKAAAVVNDNVSNRSGSIAVSDAANDDDDDDGPSYSMTFGVVALAVTSIILSVLSEILVDTLQGAAKQWALPKEFIAIILVPIVGNAAEHASAVMMAAHNKLDISIGVAIGSSIQISLFVMPALVIVAWCVNVPLDMNFHPFPVSLLFVSVLVVTNATGDGATNWLEGFMLLAAYVMVAMTFFNTNHAFGEH